MKERKRVLALSVLFLAVATVCCSQLGWAQEEGLGPKQMILDSLKVTGHVDPSFGKMVLQTADGNFKYWLDMRCWVDAAFYNENLNPLHSGVEIRRMRFAVNGVLWKNWFTQFDIGFEDDAVDIKDAYIGYMVPWGNGYLKAGNFKVQFSMEELTSSLNEDLFERSLDDGFAPGRRVGLGYTMWGNKWLASVGYFGDALSATPDPGNGQSSGTTAGVRAVYTPMLQEKQIIHLGIGLVHQTPDASTPNAWKYNSRPETDVCRDKFLKTGSIGNVSNNEMYDIEAASVFGPFRLQGDYTGVQLNRINNNPTLNFSGGYVFVGYVLTGESHEYDPKLGEFMRLFPSGASSLGALEVLFRVSTMNLNSGPVTGGKTTEYSGEIDWYFNTNVRFYLNVAHMDNDKYATGNGSFKGGDSYEMVQLRFAVQY